MFSKPFWRLVNKIWTNSMSMLCKIKIFFGIFIQAKLSKPI